MLRFLGRVLASVRSNNKIAPEISAGNMQMLRADLPDVAERPHPLHACPSAPAFAHTMVCLAA